MLSDIHYEGEKKILSNFLTYLIYPRKYKTKTQKE